MNAKLKDCKIKQKGIVNQKMYYVMDCGETFKGLNMFDLREKIENHSSNCNKKDFIHLKEGGTTITLTTEKCSTLCSNSCSFNKGGK